MTKISDNRPCPCGSGKEHKQCCGSLSPDQVGPDSGDTSAGPTAAGRGEQLGALENAVRQGDSGAAVRLGVRYLMARQAPSNPARGVALIEQAALAGDAQGAFLAATLASSSFWLAQNWDVAFDHLMRAAELGHEPAQSSLRILAGGPTGSPVSGEDWADMRDRINLGAWHSPPKIQTIREAPRIQIIKNFAPPAACDWLIAQAKDRLSRATIYDRTTGGTTEDYRRTNSQCDLDVETSGVLTFVLRGRIGEITQRRDQAMEIPKILHYAPGEAFDEHFDYLDPKEPAYAAELAVRGQRTDTFLIYLNDDFTGGETHFPRIGVTHVGATGDALLFKNINIDGVPDQDTIHTGLPPTSGEKWVFSQWIREFPRK